MLNLISSEAEQELRDSKRDPSYNGGDDDEEEVSFARRLRQRNLNGESHSSP